MRSGRSSWSLSRRTVTQILAVCLGALCALLPLGCTPAGNQNTNTANVNTEPGTNASNSSNTASTNTGMAVDSDYPAVGISKTVEAGKEARVTFIVEEKEASDKHEFKVSVDNVEIFDIDTDDTEIESKLIPKSAGTKTIKITVDKAERLKVKEISLSTDNPNVTGTVYVIYKPVALTSAGASTRATLLQSNTNTAATDRSFTTPIGVVIVRTQPVP